MCKIWRGKMLKKSCNCVMDDGFNINLVVQKGTFLQTFAMLYSSSQCILIHTIDSFIWKGRGEKEESFTKIKIKRYASMGLNISESKWDLVNNKIQNMLFSIVWDIKEANAEPTKKARKSRKSVFPHKSNDVWDTLLDPRLTLQKGKQKRIKPCFSWTICGWRCLDESRR